MKKKPFKNPIIVNAEISRIKIVNALIFITALLFLFHIAASVIPTKIGFGFFPGDNVFCRLFNMDMESNIPTWFQAAILLSSSFLAAWTALTYSKEEKKVRNFWFFVSVILMYLSIDEISILHERVRMPSNIEISFGALTLPAHFVWVIPGIVAVLIVGSLIIKPLFMIDKATRMRLFLAGFIYVAGAIGCEIIGASIWETSGKFRTLSYSLIAGVEELGEITGCIICLRAILMELSQRKSGIYIV